MKNFPVQEEPNDDREALAERLRRGPLVWNPLYHVWSTVTHDVMPVVDAVIAYRATVPDAALAECRTLRGERNTFEDDLAKEIDRANAALAAVERVRDLANSLRGRYADNSDAAYFTKQFLAALDGTPEPEVKP